MNENFKDGFEKNAGAIRKGLKTLGRLTGVSQLKTGYKQVQRATKSGLMTRHPSGKGFSTNNLPRFQKEMGPNGTVTKRLTSGAKRLAATSAAIGATGGVVHQLNKK